MLTCAGAAVGLLIGWGMSEAVSNFTPLPAEIPAWAITVSLGTAAITGMLFGLPQHTEPAGLNQSLPSDSNSCE